MTYRDIAFSGGPSAVPPFRGHHYLNTTDPADQWDVTFYPSGTACHPYPHIRVRVLTDYAANQWEVRAVVSVTHPSAGSSASTADDTNDTGETGASRL